MRLSALRRLLLGIALLTIIPVPVVRAADIQPVVTLDPIDPSVYRGDVETLTAHITDGAPNQVDFEISSDGSTWHRYAGSGQTGDGTWTHTGYVDGSTPLGTVFIRAHYPGSAGFLPADSDPRQREVLIHQGEITDFRAFNPEEPVLLPGSAPVRLTLTANAGTKLDQWIDGAWQFINQGGSSWWTDLPALGEGDHKFRARIEESDYVLGTSQELTVHIAKGETEPMWIGELTVQANHPLQAIAGLNTPQGGVTTSAQMTVEDMATSTVIASGDIGMEFTVPPMAVGTHSFLLSFAGDSNFEPSSKTFNVVVSADTADASGVGTNYTTFYPYKDGYRDTVTIRGNRLEPLSVWIRIYAPTGSLVKSVTLVRAAGSYGYVWNGRTSSGALRPAGKYKIVQVLADASGARKTVTSYVNLSHKKLVTKTSYVTKLGSSVSAKGDSGTGSIVISTSGGYARLTGKYPDGRVAVGYQFALPSATVYKAVAFQVYARGVLAVPGNYIGLQNFEACPYTSVGTWYESCFDHWTMIGNYNTSAWYSASGSPSKNRHGRTVRGMVLVNTGTFTIYKARVKVVYGVLQ